MIICYRSPASDCDDIVDCSMFVEDILTIVCVFVCVLPICFILSKIFPFISMFY